MIAAEPSALTARASSSPVLLQVRRLFTVDDYYRMAETGTLGPDERTELLDGEVVYQMPINSRHAGCVNLLNEVLVSRLAGRAVIAIQNPVRLGRLSEPQPDIAVLVPRADRYRGAHPQPADVYFLVEIADTSLDLDQRVKAPLYAAAGVRELWIVDLVNDAVEVFRDPDDRGYRRTQRHGRGDGIALSDFPDVQVEVDDILGAGAEGP